ncbi:MAG: nodulation protein NodH, partial [Silicimonas sp.]|nr:nodulation protein NodH [Silicimonas sp.]
GFIPSYEPDRGPGLRMFHVCRNAPLLYMPIRGAGRDPVPDWIRKVDPDGQVDSGLTQKELRRWMRRHPGHRSFTVLRHPLTRAYDAFCQTVIPPDVAGYGDIREALSARYGVSLPSSPNLADGWTTELQSAAFLGFLRFLAGNLGGQTSLRVDYSWASQGAFLSAIAGFVVPDRVIREDAAEAELAQLLESTGLTVSERFAESFACDAEIGLADIRSDEIDAACAEAYRRDYIFFGFERWRPDDQAARALGASVRSV